MIAVFVNMGTVFAGSLLGILFKNRISASLQGALMKALALCTVVIGVSSAIETQELLCVIICLVLGTALGELLRIDDGVEHAGDFIKTKVFRGKVTESRFTEGFVSACILFCIGSMTVLGSFESATNPADHLALECHTMLLIKSLMDFVGAVCLSVNYGVSVMASGVFVLIFQGALVALAATLQPFLEMTGAMPVMNCVGSLILLVIAVNLIGLKKIKTADYLPALFLSILVCWALTGLGVAV